jgi:transposase-like protein
MKTKKPSEMMLTVAEADDVKKQEICNNMLNNGMSISQVARSTGLSEEYVSNARDLYKKYIVK